MMATVKILLPQLRDKIEQQLSQAIKAAYCQVRAQVTGGGHTTRKIFLTPPEKNNPHTAKKKNRKKYSSHRQKKRYSSHRQSEVIADLKILDRKGQSCSLILRTMIGIV